MLDGSFVKQNDGGNKYRYIGTIIRDVCSIGTYVFFMQNAQTQWALFFNLNKFNINEIRKNVHIEFCIKTA